MSHTPYRIFRTWYKYQYASCLARAHLTRRPRRRRSLPKKHPCLKRAWKKPQDLWMMPPFKQVWLRQEAEQPQLSQLELWLKRATLVKKVAERTHFFSLHAKLLSEDARFQWDKIVTSQVDTAPWIDFRGKEQPDTCTRSCMSFMDCT